MTHDGNTALQRKLVENLHLWLEARVGLRFHRRSHTQGRLNDLCALALGIVEDRSRAEGAAGQGKGSAVAERTPCELEELCRDAHD